MNKKTCKQNAHKLNENIKKIKDKQKAMRKERYNESIDTHIL